MSRTSRTSRPGLAARLSRVLVGCHPRRWRQRYADEMLDVLEQHRAGARTVLDLAFSTLNAHLDREWRDWSRLRGMTRSAVPYALAATALTVFLGPWWAWPRGVTATGPRTGPAG